MISLRECNFQIGGLVHDIKSIKESYIRVNTRKLDRVPSTKVFTLYILGY